MLSEPIRFETYPNFKPINSGYHLCLSNPICMFADTT